MKNLSANTGYSDRMSIIPKTRIDLRTSLPIKDEIFASLGYLCDVNAAGKEFLRKLGHSPDDVKIIFPLFCAFIRQARTFYDSAITLHHRASPLIFYYSFLNFAKAYLCLSDPKSFSGKIGHGLSYQFKDSKLSTQYLKLGSMKDVFPKFYEKLTGRSLSALFRPNIGNLLRYCSDISYECESAGFGEHKRLPVRVRFLANKPSNDSFAVISVTNFQRLENYKKALKPFSTYFEEVSVNLYKSQVAKQFGLTEPQVALHRFFESKQRYKLTGNGDIPAGAISKDAFKALEFFSPSNPYSDDHDCYLHIPWSQTKQIPFNEILAIYALMFYLGSLVRYNPAYMERIVQSKDAWIIERFVHSCGISYLRHMANLIENIDKIYSFR